MSRQGVATTTYGYDAFGSRVFQSTGTTTALYPFKWYSVASSTGTGAKYATTTEYVFNGDSLVSTIDQQTASGAATGTAQTSFIHPDRLGSTNVVTNASGTVVQTLDYYPYGAARISTSVGGADSARKYIGQFADASNLDYLNARYYDGNRGQFLSEDPLFVGDQRAQNLMDPQSLNAYSYSDDDPIGQRDPSGQGILLDLARSYAQQWTFNQITNNSSVQNFATNLGNQNEGWNFAMNHPVLTGGALSVGIASVMVPGSEGVESIVAAHDAYLIGNTSAAASRILPSLLYTGAAAGNFLTLPGYFGAIQEANSTRNYGPLAFETGLRMVPAAGNAYGAFTSSLLLSNLSTG